MKKTFLFFLLSVVILQASAQKVYFVYIQTEAGSPFYVKIKERVQSSSGNGYIIIPSLIDSTYQVSVGFPGNKIPEQKFSITINKKDHGYLLKEFAGKGWGLFDLQTLEVQMANGAVAHTEDKPQEKNEVSPFTEILALAADDPSLKDRVVKPVVPEKQTEEVVKKDPPKKNKEKEEKPVVVKTADKPEEVKNVEPVTAVAENNPSPKTDTAAVVSINNTDNEKKEPVPVLTEKKEEEKKTEPVAVVSIDTVKQSNETIAEKKEESGVVINEATYKPSNIKRWAESSTTEGFGIVYIDSDDKGNGDTIRVVIPNPKPAVMIAMDTAADEKKFISVNELPKNENAEVAIEKKKPEEVKKEPVKNNKDKEELAIVQSIVKDNNCREEANGDDFVKLRKQMASVETDDDMISEAKKYFKQKCFTTRQIKLLGTLFLTDEGKYGFFDVAYKFVTDKQAFASLQEELKDEYYATRFKAMLRN